MRGYITQTFAVLDSIFYFMWGNWIWGDAPLRNTEPRALFTTISAKKRDVCGNNSPAFRKAHPRLALAAPDGSAINGAFKLQRDLGVILAEGDDIESQYLARQIGGNSSLAKRGDLFKAVEIFRHAKTHGERRIPKQVGKRFHVVGDQGGFVHGIERLEFRDDAGVIDLHD